MKRDMPARAGAPRPSTAPCPARRVMEKLLELQLHRNGSPDLQNQLTALCQELVGRDRFGDLTVQPNVRFLSDSVNQNKVRMFNPGLDLEGHTPACFASILYLTWN